MQVLCDTGGLAQRIRECGGQVVHLERRQAEPGEPRRRPRLAHEAGERVVAVAIAAEVDSRQDDLEMTLPDAPPDLGEHGLGSAAS